MLMLIIKGINMPRGGHRTGYNWGLSSKEKITMDVPRKIVEKVKLYAQQLWEEEKQREEIDKKIVSTQYDGVGNDYNCQDQSNGLIK